MAELKADLIRLGAPLWRLLDDPVFRSAIERPGKLEHHLFRHMVERTAMRCSISAPNQADLEKAASGVQNLRTICAGSLLPFLPFIEEAEEVLRSIGR